MRALILGCGYVGTALGAELAGRGVEVYGLRRTEGPQTHLPAAGIRPVLGDLTRPADLAKLPGPFDWIVNTASSGRGGLEEYRRIYLEGTRTILDWLQAAPPTKYVYTSSTGVYAQTDGSWVTEISPTEPTSPTSQVLLQTEKLLLQAWADRAFPAVILRVAGIYGPGRGYPYLQLGRDALPRVPPVPPLPVGRGEGGGEGSVHREERAGERRPFPATSQQVHWQGGERFMNMIHRDDVAGAIIAALERGQPGEIFNAVDDEPVTQKAFYEWLSARLGKPMPPSAPVDEQLQRKRGFTNKRVSNRKLKRELACHLKYPTFREGYAHIISQLDQR